MRQIQELNSKIAVLEEQHQDYVQKQQNLIAAIAQKIKTFLQTGYYAVEPDVEQDACQYCPYDLVCRKGSRQSRKGINL